MTHFDFDGVKFDFDGDDFDFDSVEFDFDGDDFDFDSVEFDFDGDDFDFDQANFLTCINFLDLCFFHGQASPFLTKYSFRPRDDSDISCNFILTSTTIIYFLT